MSDRDTMVGRIQDETRRSDVGFTAIIVEHINDAIAHYQKQRFYFNETRSVTFSTVADQSIYTFSGASPDIGTEFYRIDMAVLEESTNDYILTRRDYTELEWLIDGSTTSNRPYNYGYVNQSLVLYPIPDAVYTVRLTGHAKLAAPAAGDTANNDWMTEAFDLIRGRALWSLHKRVLDDGSMGMKIAGLKSDEMDARSALMGATADKVALGCIEPTTF